MSLTRERVPELERKSVQVLQECDAFIVPVDLDKVCAAHRVKVHMEPLEDNVSGVLIIKGGERHALINAAHHTNRQRFSLAHEIGHLLLHDNRGDRLFIDTRMRVYQRAGAPHDDVYTNAHATTKPHEEAEANMFASALLMPKPLLEKAAKGLDLEEEAGIATLARMFAVSDQAMSIRLQQLNLVTVLTFDN